MLPFLLSHLDAFDHLSSSLQLAAEEPTQMVWTCPSRSKENAPKQKDSKAHLMCCNGSHWIKAPNLKWATSDCFACFCQLALGLSCQSECHSRPEFLVMFTVPTCAIIGQWHVEETDFRFALLMVATQSPCHSFCVWNLVQS